MIPRPAGDGEPTPTQLRWFGAAIAGSLVVLGAVARWKWHAPNIAWLPWGAAAVLGLLYYGVPALRRPIFVGWRRLFRPLEQAFSFVALAAVYYGVITPLALLLRAAGRDALGCRFDPGASSYFTSRRPDRDPARYFQQF